MAPEFGKPIHQLPLIPVDVLKKRRVHESLDTRFRSADRLLEAGGPNCKACQQTQPTWHMRASLKRYAMQIFLDIGILVCHHVFISIGINLKERDIL
jgi:hypothetical protein